MTKLNHNRPELRAHDNYIRELSKLNSLSESVSMLNKELKGTSNQIKFTEREASEIWSLIESINCYHDILLRSIKDITTKIR